MRNQTIARQQLGFMMMKGIGNKGNITIMHNGKKLIIRPLNLQNKVIEECYVSVHYYSDKYEKVSTSYKRVQLPIRMSIERAKRYVAMNKLGEFYLEA